MTLHSTASPKELQQLKRKLARYRRYDRPSRLKLSEIARAQRFVVNDELKWNNKDFKCKIIVSPTPFEANSQSDPIDPIIRWSSVVESCHHIRVVL